MRMPVAFNNNKNKKGEIIMRQIKSLAQARQEYAVNRPGQWEAITQTLYDYTTYAVGGQSTLNFFANPIGQGTTSHPGSTGPKTKADTNMSIAGSLPTGQYFVIESIEIHMLPSTPPASFGAVAALTEIGFTNDIFNVGRSGFLELVVGSKPYLTEAPLNRFPPKTRLEGKAALASNSATTGLIAIDYASWGGRPYALKAPITLESNQNFSLALTWPNAVGLDATNTACRMGVVFDGVLYRSVQ